MMSTIRLRPEADGFKEFRTVVDTPQAQFLHDLFKSANYELRIAGGAVRDILRGQVPQDVDFATDATPTQMINLLEKHADRVRLILTRSGQQHGTVTARIDDKEQYEVTTLRIDKKTDGRHAEVEFIKDWQLDANRRDLTINSMFLDFDGTLYDFFDGLPHLKNNVIRFVGNAEDRITEDYLRILCYFRFFARYGGQTHDENILQCMRELNGGLEQISGERLWSEMKKLIPLKRSDEMLCHSNLWANELQFEPMTLFAALIRDESEVDSVIKRLRCSKVERETALYIVRHRDQPTSDLCGIKESLALNGKSEFNLGKKCALEYFKYTGDLKSHDELNNWQLPDFPVRGTVVLEHLENKQDKRQIAKVLLELKKVWIRNDYETSEEELLSEIPNVMKAIKQRKKSE
ncbi:CCA tRNA nucleotidyltransferase 1-like protein [Leptotrombidium deliense]|uniref:CCA tRNA nucleotidyltransferase 1-like protein n=1 Tax=Leptotrombidium deliense TaxID=299467 RepID=A0A443S6C4_9ACAR|nr:CCA tRNA nucleotidyltransferase 1-like protein [Leptotrombidium deliense]